MKTTIYLIVLLFSGLYATNTIAQDENLAYHFACAETHDFKKPILYYSAIASCYFIDEYNFEDHQVEIAPEIKRQFIDYLNLHLKKEQSLEFVDYAMSNNLAEVEKKWQELLKTYKKKGYKLVQIKHFVYD
jgi:hypothetical protein